MFCHNFFNLPSSGRAHAIFVANLPMSATVEQLDRAFKKFGPIKRDGIQVRSNKVRLFSAFPTPSLLTTHQIRLFIQCLFLLQQGSCFGFVEFESAASMQSALEVWSISINSCYQQGCKLNVGWVL
jgi:RNA recognition motif-containing protein